MAMAVLEVAAHRNVMVAALEIMSMWKIKLIKICTFIFIYKYNIKYVKIIDAIKL